MIRRRSTSRRDHYDNDIARTAANTAYPPANPHRPAMTTLLLWVLAAGLIVLCRWSDDQPTSRRKRAHDADFWLWEHEPTREVTHE